jgi:hypothetical protein
MRPAPPPLLYGPRGEPLPRIRPNGQPQNYLTFFEGANRYPDGDTTLMAYYWSANQDLERLLPLADWKQLMNAGRFLFANVPIVRGALLEQATYSFPLEPHYIGADLDWGRLAKEWLFYWRQNAEVRGPMYNSYTSARVRLFARKTDGDIARLLTYDEGTDYPRLQFIRAHRIGSRDYDPSSGLGKLKEGPFAGFRCYNGIILDNRGGPIGYNILGDTQDEDNQVPASDLVFTYNPDYADQMRGISELMACIKSFADIKRLREYEMRAQQIQARESLIEKNEEGEAQPGTGFFAPSAGAAPALVTSQGTSPTSPVVVEQLDKGLTRFYRSNSGSGLELLRPDRPGPGCQEFENRILAGAFYGIEWDPNFALAIKEPGGAWARTILQKINRAIANNQRIEAQACLAEDTWALARAIKSKLIPAPKDGEFWEWDYSGPARLTADSGNDENAKREKYKIGALTLRKWVAEDGEWWEEIRTQKEIETRDLLVRATAIQKDFPGLKLQEVCELLEQRFPNAVPAPGAGAPEAGKPEPSAAGK